jgi:general secretion pathway protein C
LITRYIKILNLILVTVAIYFSVAFFYKIVSLKLDSVLSFPAIENQNSTAEINIPNKLSHYDAISKRNLFNIGTKAQNTTNPTRINALKQTDLKLKLWGTVIGPDAKDYAVIELNGGKQNLYRVGDTVLNANVKLILRGKIILDVNGKDEILEMEKLSSEVKSKPQRIGRHEISQRIHVKRSQIKNATQNISQLLQQVNIRPNFENGKSSGLMLSRIKPNSIFNKMGLMNGDIIIGANGEQIVSIDHAIKIYENLKSSNNVKLEIKRKGRNQTIDYIFE